MSIFTKKKVTKDGFIWLIVTKKAKNLFITDLFPIYELFEDDTENVITTMKQLNQAIEEGREIGIEVGYL